MTIPKYSSKIYKDFRPTYPPELFKIIYDFHKIKVGNSFDFAADIGCGTGQATICLSHQFKSVKGIEPSKEMLESAEIKDNIEYINGHAEEINVHLKEESVDLVTVAEAAHWFDMNSFYQEAHKILKPNGTLAIFAYQHLHILESPKASQLLEDFSTKTMAPWWDERRPRLDRLYSDPDYTTHHPFAELKRTVYEPHESMLRKDWSLGRIRNYLSTWSPYKKYLETAPANQQDPIDSLMKNIQRELDSNNQDLVVPVAWRFVLILGRK